MIRTALLTMLAVSVFALPSRADDAGTTLYQKVLRSVVWISVNTRAGTSTGSGSLIDQERRLVLTNYHVVGDAERVTVVFPRFRGTELIAEREEYLKALRRDGHRGVVKARDRRCDLALIQLDDVPALARALPLATVPVSPGQAVHSIGNPGRSGALWVYTPGKVRQVYHKRWKAKLDRESVSFEAKVIETDSPTNPGDSGGPLVNDKGELVGVTQGAAVDAQALSIFIDVAEVRRFLTGQRLSPPETPPLPRMGPLSVRDDGAFFSTQTLKAADEAIQELYKKFKKDLLVETYPAVPAEKRDALEAEGRAAFFRTWGSERMRAREVNGVLILACKDPPHLRVDVSLNARSAFPEAAVRRLTETLLEAFRKKEYDAGLMAAVKLVRESFEKP